MSNEKEKEQVRKPPNPSAYPRPFSASQNRWYLASDGMTLRDYFAIRFAATFYASWYANCPTTRGIAPEDISDAAYRYADAMLTERDKQ